MARSSTRSLAGIELLAELPPDDIAKLEQLSGRRNYAAKEQILDRLSEGTDVFFVVNGSVLILNYSPAGREVSFAEVHRGGYFGELSALDKRRRSASAMAITETTLASVTADTFRNLLLDHPKIAWVVLLHLAHMVRAGDARIMDLSTLSAINRVHAEIRRLAEPSEDDDNVGVIRPIPTHSVIASRAGTTRETVSRVLSNLVSVRIVERGRDAITVLDLQRLSEIIEDSSE